MSRRNKPLTARDRWLILLLASPFLGAGLYVMGIGLRWFPVDPAKVHAPGWVLAICGLVFLSGGVAFLSLAWRNSQPHKIVAFSMMIGLTIVTHWVAFGSGERQFRSTRTVNGIRIETGTVDEQTGRRFFAIGAVLLDLAFVTMGILYVRKRILKP